MKYTAFDLVAALLQAIRLHNIMNNCVIDCCIDLLVSFDECLLIKSLLMSVYIYAALLFWAAGILYR